MDYEGRPEFLIESNYKSKEEYLSYIYNTKIEFVCDYCGTGIIYKTYADSDKFICEKCGAPLK